MRILEGSSLIEIGYNTFKNKSNNTQHEKGYQLLQIVVLNQNERHHIHHNLFSDIAEGVEMDLKPFTDYLSKSFDPPPGDSNSVVGTTCLKGPMGKPKSFQLNQMGISLEETF